LAIKTWTGIICIACIIKNIKGDAGCSMIHTRLHEVDERLPPAPVLLKMIIV